MLIVVGLGNPGTKYTASRHNVGWWVVDRLAYDWGFDSFNRDGRAFLTEGDVGESSCLLYPSDAADDRRCVCLGGRTMPSFNYTTF